jgi:hypothetical protein
MEYRTSYQVLVPATEYEQPIPKTSENPARGSGSAISLIVVPHWKSTN